MQEDRKRIYCKIAGSHDIWRSTGQRRASTGKSRLQPTAVHHSKDTEELHQKHPNSRTALVCSSVNDTVSRQAPPCTRQASRTDHLHGLASKLLKAIPTARCMKCRSSTEYSFCAPLWRLPSFGVTPVCVYTRGDLTSAPTMRADHWSAEAPKFDQNTRADLSVDGMDADSAWSATVT